MTEHSKIKRHQHQFLQIAPMHLGKDSAQRSVRATLKRLNVYGKLDWLNGKLRLPQSNGGFREVALMDLVEEARDYGVSKTLYRILDGQDVYFGDSLEIATNSKLTVGIEFAGYSRKLKGPCRFFPIEGELTDDILFHRRAACETSASADFTECSRHFRAYLQSAVSIMDAFINRYVLILEYNKTSVPECLRGPSGLEDRIDSWVRGIANRDPSELRQGPEWSQFSELRQERNRLVHAVEPYMGMRVQELPRFLNDVRKGLGGLLLKMRNLAGESTLGFIERLRTAPEVSFKARS